MIELYQQTSPFAKLGYAGNEITLKKPMLANSSLNGRFIKEVEDVPYCGFQEPWYNDQGKKN